MHKKCAHRDPAHCQPIKYISVASAIVKRMIKIELIEYITEGKFANISHIDSSEKFLLPPVLPSALVHSLRLLAPVVYLDIRKAVGRLFHRRLINRIKSLEIIGLKPQWITSHVSSIIKVTQVNRYASHRRAITKGTVRNGVLERLLFFGP